MRYPDPFLAAHGFAAAERRPLPADASFRRYVRLVGGPRPALLMDAPPPEDVRPFAALARHFGAAGLSLPQIIAEDAGAGFLLIEDFGEATHAALLDAGADPVPLYTEAAEALAALHAAAPPPGLPAWDAAAMARATAATFLDWWWPAAFGRDPAGSVRAELDAAIHAMLAPFAGTSGFVHRDFFPANLMRLEERDGPRRTGILDFQDGAIGHPAYDVISLVEDARRDVLPTARRAALAAYLNARPGLDRGAFLGAMAACGAQRHLRVAALWVRLERRDGKPHYLRHGPRCWALLARSLSQPACAPLRDFLDRHIPEELRRNPAPG
ncbi:aminoglycoside phosphotransferase family protein [Paracraurococcus ruber]|uniref:Aminoglycoside phosphotransferase n=1 Tax=Paracraurococcus ruber TaxID=77675 RepID=A0ABS1D780_9PROT|nr:phosphotransferase [Paracraurococcus ruber]MBK1661729.1 aminoglycoside phosphotransferase [Paracraurococcus ruber]TDG17999.1 aminoglycoside phosphotransferase [Paracraurococcus ruber]